MQNKIFHLIGLCTILLAGVACGRATSVAPRLNNTPTNTTQPIQVPVIDADSSPVAELGCEAFNQFCVTSTVQGTVTATAVAGVGSNFNNDCTTWAAGGDPRLLELPLMFAAGEDKITVALTRIGAYTGPGRYELKAVSTKGLPDSFPAIEVVGRTFSNGEGSAAVVTIAADGSGSIQAVGLVEQASIQVSNPDPSARIDFSMQWTCMEEK
jgi:hypothetical protein